MWIRAELKSRAKGVLKGNYWLAFGVCLIFLIATGFFSFIQSFQYNQNPNASLTLLSSVSLVWSIFIGFPLNIGLCYFFIRGREQDFEFSHLLARFKHGYGQSIAAVFLVGLFVFLWSLLLLIPGIIKSYSYRMVPWLIAENPDIGYSRAFAISKQTMRGEKWRVFVLDLSFIGWYLLCGVTLGLGIFFLCPYIMATQAELYDVLKQKAVTLGYSELQDQTFSAPATDYINDTAAPVRPTHGPEQIK